ncbi:hypothetical protein HPB50_028855 [Hyalomma asiaticum]|nr:hypothetical protein HPB50_028855 [Hyalomma asiaticum]
MTWPLLKHRCIVSRVGLSGTGCETATQPPIPPQKRLFSLRGLLHEVASSTMRRLMKELGVSAECKHQFVKFFPLKWTRARTPALRSLHHAPLAVTAAAGAIAAAVAVNARWASLNGNRSVAAEKVVGERAASIDVFRIIDIGP